MEYTEEQENFMNAVKNNTPEGYSLCYDGEDLGFTWRGCDSCGSSLGGDRFKLNYYNATTKDIIEASACVDCVCYVANADVPETWSKN